MSRRGKSRSTRNTRRSRRAREAAAPTPRRDAPPADVPRDLFLVWRAPRVGMRNPQRMTNAAWAWLARHPEINAWAANRMFDGPTSMLVGPGWCASRFGRSETTLLDGRVIAIGGEHEDYYDPDFYIYNDVIVTGPAGELEIYGYPHEVFPPTDFHSATLVGDRIIVIGRLGYHWQREPGRTSVFALDTRTLAIAPVASAGAAPGWIFEHAAELADDGRTITVRGGKRAILRDGAGDIARNIDDWSLDVERGLWTRLTDRRWPQWELARADGSANALLSLACEAIRFEVGRPNDRERLTALAEELGGPADFSLYAARYAPPLAHTPLDADDDGLGDARISVDGVTVRYEEQSHAVRVTVEGDLPEATVVALVEDARAKLGTLERRPWTASRIDG